MSRRHAGLTVRVTMPATILHMCDTYSAPPDPDAVLDVALEALRFEHAHAEAARSRAAGLLTACGVLLAVAGGIAWWRQAAPAM